MLPKRALFRLTKQHQRTKTYHNFGTVLGEETLPHVNQTHAKAQTKSGDSCLAALTLGALCAVA